MINWGKNNLLIFGAFLGIGTLILITLCILEFDGLYGQDSYEYIRQAQEVKQALLTLSKPDDFYWAPGYPSALAIIDLMIGNKTISAQLLSLIIWSSTLFVCWKALKFIGEIDFISSFLTVLSIVGFSAYFFRVNFTSMSDGLAALFTTLVFYHVLIQKKHTSSLFWILFFSGLSIITRYACLPLVIIPIGFSLFQMIRSQNWKYLIIGLITLITLSLFFLYLKDSSPEQILNQSIVQDWSFSNYFKSVINNEQGQLNYDFPNFLFILFPFIHLGFIWICIPVFVIGLILKSRISSPIILISLCAYLLFLGGIPFQNKRFLILVIPGIFMTVLPVILEILEKIKLPKLGLLLLLIINIGLSAYSFRTLYKIQQEEVYLLNELTAYDIQELYTFDVDIALKGRGFSSEIHNLWMEDNLTLEKGDYFLINETRWREQWADHLLMKNVNEILETENLNLVKSLKEGWQLYKIE